MVNHKAKSKDKGEVQDQRGLVGPARRVGWKSSRRQQEMKAGFTEGVERVKVQMSIWETQERRESRRGPGSGVFLEGCSLVSGSSQASMNWLEQR